MQVRESACVWGTVADNELGHQKADQGGRASWKRKRVGREGLP